MLTIIFSSILISLVFAPLGCLVLWRQYVYFGDGLAHATMLAGATATVAGLPLFLTSILTTLIFALTVFKLKNKSGNNAAVGITASIMVSLASIISYLYPEKLNIAALLFGDIIAADRQDLLVLTLLSLIVIGFFTINYRQILLTTLSRDIASARGARVQMIEFTFLAILSFAILSTVKIVGALLVTSIILIPAMTAKVVAKTPLMMIVYAILFSLMMSGSGILLSFNFDIPFAPVITISGGSIYLAILLIKKYLSS